MRLKRRIILFISIILATASALLFSANAEERFFQDRGVDWLGDTLTSHEIFVSGEMVPRIQLLDSLFVLATYYGYVTLFPTDTIIIPIEYNPTVHFFNNLRGRFNESNAYGDSVIQFYGPTDRRTFDLLKVRKYSGYVFGIGNVLSAGIGSYAYLIKDIWNFSNYLSPVFVDSLPFDSHSPYTLQLNNHLYTYDRSESKYLSIIDISVPESPVILNSFYVPEFDSVLSLNETGLYQHKKIKNSGIWSMAFAENDRYNHFVVYDLSDPLNPGEPIDYELYNHAFGGQELQVIPIQDGLFALSYNESNHHNNRRGYVKIFDPSFLPENPILSSIEFPIQDEGDINYSSSSVREYILGATETNFKLIRVDPPESLAVILDIPQEDVLPIDQTPIPLAWKGNWAVIRYPNGRARIVKFLSNGEIREIETLPLAPSNATAFFSEEYLIYDAGNYEAIYVIDYQLEWVQEVIPIRGNWEVSGPALTVDGQTYFFHDGRNLVKINENNTGIIVDTMYVGPGSGFRISPTRANQNRFVLHYSQLYRLCEIVEDQVVILDDLITYNYFKGKNFYPYLGNNHLQIDNKIISIEGDSLELIHDYSYLIDDGSGTNFIVGCRGTRVVRSFYGREVEVLEYNLETNMVDTLAKYFGHGGDKPEGVLFLSADTLLEIRPHTHIRYVLNGDFNSVPEYPEQSEQVSHPDQFVLDPIYPNPFNPTITVPFHIPEVANVEIAIYNLLGQKIATLLNQRMSPGSHQVVWNSEAEMNTVSSGVFFVRMEADGFVQSRKIVLMK